MELGSGFVLAVIVAAVLLVDRLGGSDELARRLFQIALAGAIAFTVVSGANAAIRINSGSDSVFSSDSGDDDTQDQIDRVIARQTAQFGAGVVVLLAGLATMRSGRTIPLAGVLGGLLLILFSGAGGSASSAGFYGLFLGQLGAAASAEMALISFLVFFGGTAFLLWFGFRQYEGGRAQVAASEDWSEPPA